MVVEEKLVWEKDINAWDDIVARSDKGRYMIRREIFDDRVKGRFFLSLAGSGELVRGFNLGLLKYVAEVHLATGVVPEGFLVEPKPWSLEYP